MENRNDFEPSDLIYLFLDGEADSVQQTMLFGMLAASSDLQGEFSEALQLRTAVETERSESAPPAALTRDLFEKAGFAVAPATTAPIASSAALPAAILGMLRRFGIPLLCAAAGAILTALLFQNAYQERYGRMEEQIRRLSAERGTIAVAGTNRMRGEGGVMSDPAREIEGGNGASAVRADGAGTGQATGRERLAAGRDGTGATSRRTAERAAHETSTAAIARTDHAATMPVTERNEEEARVIASPALEPTPAMAVAPVLKDVPSPDELPAMRSTSATSETAMPWNEPGEGDTRGFSLQLRGMTDVRFFPSLESSKEAQPWFNNMSIGGLYHLSSNQAFGIELGQEYLPMYRSNGAEVTKDDHISWITGLYLLQGDPITILGRVRPFVQGGVGASESGPVGRGTIGLAYAPEGRVDLAIGAEGTAFLYHLDGTWYSAKKAGITYMMRVHF